TAPLLDATGNHCPEALAPALARGAARPLGHHTVEHHEADGLLRHIVGRLHSGRAHEAEVALPMLLQPFGHVAIVPRRRHVARAHAPHLRARRRQLLSEARALREGAGYHEETRGGRDARPALKTRRAPAEAGARLISAKPGSTRWARQVIVQPCAL